MLPSTRSASTDLAEASCRNEKAGHPARSQAGLNTCLKGSTRFNQNQTDFILFEALEGDVSSNLELMSVHFHSLPGVEQCPRINGGSVQRVFSQDGLQAPNPFHDQLIPPGAGWQNQGKNSKDSQSSNLPAQNVPTHTSKPSTNGGFGNRTEGKLNRFYFL